VGDKEILRELHLKRDGQTALAVGDQKVDAGVLSREPQLGAFESLLDLGAHQDFTCVDGE